ncbi:hypothetical protein JCM8097_004181 [Rhodosporidiobolus ruineniae]
MQVEADLYVSTITDGGSLHPMSDILPRTFGGKWDWGFTRVGCEGTKDRCGIVWSGTKRTMYIAGGHIKVYCMYARGSAACEIRIPPGTFPPSVAGMLESRPVKTSCPRFELVLETPTLASLRGEHEGSMVSLGKELDVPGFTKVSTCLSDLLAHQVPHNVVLRFPRCSREIWTCESILARSPYLKMLLSSGFNESLSLAPEVSKDSSTTSLVEHRKTGVLSRLCGLVGPSKTKVFPPLTDDSDDEADLALPKPASRSPATKLEVLPHKIITITEASYTTYLAVIGYLYTGEILFSPLRAGRGKTAAAPRTTFLIPASPKSVYRLSHLLELDALSSLALSNFSSQLTPSIAASELFSPLARLYPDIGEAILRYVVDKAHYSAVMEVQEMKERARRVEEGEAEPEEAAMMYKILRRDGEGR